MKNMENVLHADGDTATCWMSEKKGEKNFCLRIIFVKL